MERKFQIENIAKNNDDSEYRPELDNTPRLKEKVIEEPVLLSQREASKQLLATERTELA